MPKSIMASPLQKASSNPNPDASTKARQENGKAVGALACEIFPHGRKVSYDASDMQDMAILTKVWIEEGVNSGVPDENEIPF